MMPVMLDPQQHMQWIDDACEPAGGYLKLLDQTRLPGEIAWLDCRDVQGVWEAIKRLSVRGAPAIGVAAAYGCVIGAGRGDLAAAADHLASSRPTAVNLFWAIDRMKALGTSDPVALLAEARRIHEEDRAMCRAIGEHGVELIPEGGGVLTHCNAGALATGGIGTATAPMYLAHELGRPFTVFADETRPLLQGARLTAWELGAAGLAVTVICDSMAAQVMREGRVSVVITGADRIAGNGDAANKIGTYGLAVLAKHHGIPFYVAAPSSTFDLSLAGGESIPIEQREAIEVREGLGRAITPPEVAVYNPAFDVTPADLICGIITERGMIRPVNAQHVNRILDSNRESVSP